MRLLRGWCVGEWERRAHDLSQCCGWREICSGGRLWRLLSLFRSYFHLLLRCWELGLRDEHCRKRRSRRRTS